MSIPNNLHSTTTQPSQINGTSGLQQQQQQQSNNNNINNGPVLSNGRTNNLLNNNQEMVYGGSGKVARKYYNGYDGGDGTNSLSRLAPEGKDAELVKDETRNNNNKIGAGGGVEDAAGIPPTEVFSTSSNENGKINVQVTVLFGKLTFFYIFLIKDCCKSILKLIWQLFVVRAQK